MLRGAKMISNRIVDLTKEKFGRLQPIKYLGKSNWLCKCDCGNEIIASNSKLRRGKKKSCGCLAKEQNLYNEIKSDPRFKRLHTIWAKMKERCYNPKHDSYRHYGAKGIKVCDKWKDSFASFYWWSINNGYEDVDGEFKDMFSIDRIDSSKDYCPENCRWVTISENCSIKSPANKVLEELMEKSTDTMVQEYLERKMENNLVIQKEKREIRYGGFPCRKNNYCVIKNNDNTKQFLFKSFKVVGMFLNISPSSVSYRIKNKNGILTNDWRIEKIDKEQYDCLRNKGIEVII